MFIEVLNVLKFGEQ